MSLGQPDLYIGGQLMQTAKADPRPALAGLRVGWGTDDRLELDPPSTLSGQLLIRGAMPSFLEVGAPVGLVDPVSARCLFAGNLAPLKAAPDEGISDGLRVSFTAASPLAELVKHKVVDFDWPHEDTAATRRNRLAGSMPRGWTLGGAAGWTWINQGRQKYLDGASIEWVELLARYVRSYRQRYHDTSYYTPGAGLFKRITITDERGKVTSLSTPPGTRGTWAAGLNGTSGAAGFAVLPTSAVTREIEWEKTPADVVTDVQVSSWGVADGANTKSESWEWSFPMDLYVNNQALQDAYGFRQAKIETSISGYNGAAFNSWLTNDIVPYWLDAATKWRPTTLQLPDSRELDTAPLLNLLAVDTRHMAAVSVPGATTLAPGLIRSFVMAGSATWTGKKWITDLTLGRTL